MKSVIFRRATYVLNKVLITVVPAAAGTLGVAGYAYADTGAHHGCTVSRGTCARSTVAHPMGCSPSPRRRAVDTATARDAAGRASPYDTSSADDLGTSGDKSSNSSDSQSGGYSGNTGYDTNSDTGYGTGYGRGRGHRRDGGGLTGGGLLGGGGGL